MTGDAVRRTVLNKQGERTRATVLDAAELLFGRGTYDSVSMRRIAEEAGVLLGVVSYHFTSKEALFREVAKRRADEVNDLRLARLRTYAHPTVDQIVDAFIRPVLEVLEHGRWRDYMQLLTQISHDHRWRDLDSELFTDSVAGFVEALQRAMPDADPVRLRMGFLHGIAVLLSLLGGGMDRSDLLALQSVDPSDRSLIDSAVAFVAGGLRAAAYS